MTDNERLVVCARDAINELLHRCQDLKLTKSELLMIGDGLKSMVTFKDDVQAASQQRLLKLLDNRVLDRSL
tara:strand:- start:2416 stop:2628 length:213 start_codon:yes stop_codon:yes gene_type:complete